MGQDLGPRKLGQFSCRDGVRRQDRPALFPPQPRPSSLGGRGHSEFKSGSTKPEPSQVEQVSQTMDRCAAHRHPKHTGAPRTPTYTRV